jgi:NADH:ubiquinone oxidoreductase subunit 6 (subunit J)
MMVEPSLILFYIAAALTLGGALGVVMTRNIVYAAFALLAALMGVAGVFLLVFAEFLALVQILIYGGAVVIVLLFALMLTRLEDFDNLTDHKQWPIAAIISIGLFGLLAAAITTTAVRTTERQTVDFETLGEILFTQWAIPFEVASLVLLVALIGSIILVRVDGDRD